MAFIRASRGTRVVLYEHWSAIDERERTAGAKLGRPRVKLVTWDDLLEAAEDVAAAVRFLCSPAARYINGQAIHANGGAYFGG